MKSTTDLKQMVEQGSFPCTVYVFTGEEVFLRELYIRKMREHFEGDGFEDFNIYFFEGDGFDTAALSGAVEAMPVMATRKFIHIKNSGIFRSGSEKLKQVCEDFILACPDYCCVVFDESQVDGRSALLKKAKDKGIFHDFKYLNAQQLVAWVKKRFQEVGKTIRDEDAAYLAVTCDDGLLLLNHEVEKLLSYIGEEGNVSVDIIKKLVTKSVGNHIFEMIDAIASGDGEKLFTILGQLQTLKEQPPKIIAVLGKQIATLFKVRVLYDEGRQGEIASAAGVPPFFVKKYVSQATGFSPLRLEKMVAACMMADREIKLGLSEGFGCVELLCAKLLKGLL